MGRLLGRLGAKIEAPTDIRCLRAAELNRHPAAGQLDNETTLRGDLFRLAAFANTPLASVWRSIAQVDAAQLLARTDQPMASLSAFA
jgi:hypothetical protein